MRVPGEVIIVVKKLLKNKSNVGWVSNEADCEEIYDGMRCQCLFPPL